MKKNWLLYLVVFSLALNFGTIGAFAYWRYQDRRAQAVWGEQPPLPPGALWRELQMDATQRQALRPLFPGHRQRVRELRQELGRKRHELFTLLQAEAPSWEAMQGKVKEISALQGSLEEEMLRFMVEVRKHLRPEQQAALMNKVQARLGCPMDGPSGSCDVMGPPGRGRMRGGPWRGGPPGPPGGPPPP